MQHRHRRPEARAGGAHEHRRQADLGHEDDRPAAPLEGRLDGAEVDLRLPAAGHAVEEERPEHPAGERIEQRPERGLLVRGRDHRHEVSRRQPFGRAHVALVDEAHGSLSGEPTDRPPQGRAVADEVGHARSARRRPAVSLQDLRLRAAARRRVGTSASTATRTSRKPGRVDRPAPRPRGPRGAAAPRAPAGPAPVASRGPTGAAGRPAARGARNPPCPRWPRSASRGGRPRGSPALPRAAGPAGSTRPAARGSGRPSRRRGRGAAAR